MRLCVLRYYDFEFVMIGLFLLMAVECNILALNTKHAIGAVEIAL